MDDEAKIKPPYLSYTTLKNFLASLNAAAIPARIDKTLMSGQSGTTQSYLMSSLRFLGLIDSFDRPLPELKALVTSASDERKAVWAPIFEKAYQPVIKDLDLKTATVGMLHECFSALGLNGDTVKKCHSFFSAAAEDAGVPLPPQLKPKARGGSTGARRGKKRLKKNEDELPSDEEFPDDNVVGQSVETSQVATLLLDGEGKRVVKIKAPAAISSAELDRIQKWLSFQLIIHEA